MKGREIDEEKKWSSWDVLEEEWRVKSEMSKKDIESDCSGRNIQKR